MWTWERPSGRDSGEYFLPLFLPLVKTGSSSCITVAVTAAQRASGWHQARENTTSSPHVTIVPRLRGCVWRAGGSRHLVVPRHSVSRSCNSTIVSHHGIYIFFLFAERSRANSPVAHRLNFIKFPLSSLISNTSNRPVRGKQWLIFEFYIRISRQFPRICD